MHLLIQLAGQKEVGLYIELRNFHMQNLRLHKSYKFLGRVPI